MRFRLEVEESPNAGGRRVARNFDTGTITPRQRRLVEPVAGTLAL